MAVAHRSNGTVHTTDVNQSTWDLVTAEPSGAAHSKPADAWQLWFAYWGG